MFIKMVMLIEFIMFFVLIRIMCVFKLENVILSGICKEFCFVFCNFWCFNKVFVLRSVYDIFILEFVGILIVIVIL